MNTNGYNAQDFYELFHMAIHVVRNNRPWFQREYFKSPIHRAVELAILQARPDDWQQLLLEYPHIAESDPTRLAYTRDERAGEADRQTITTVGKYLTRHFPTLPDHIIRDIVARTTTQSNMFIVDNMPLMLHHLMDGPGSCMNNGWNDEDRGEHPYNAYAPELGWSMAVRVKEGVTHGRALIYREPDGTRYFVRSYKRTDGYSHSDEELETWMREQGINKRGDWCGAFLAKLPPIIRHCEFLAPFLDGNCKTVDVYDAQRLLITEEGAYECSNTDGTHDDAERTECTHCGAMFNSTDDGYWTGSHDENWVCSGCIDEYTEVTGRYGNTYYLNPNDGDVITDIHGNAYDARYLSANDIIELHNGDYAPLDDAWCCNDSGEYYLHDEVTPVEIDGSFYHPDSDKAIAHAEQTEETTDEE